MARIVFRALGPGRYEVRHTQRMGVGLSFWRKLGELTRREIVGDKPYWTLDIEGLAEPGCTVVEWSLKDAKAMTLHLLGGV